MPIKAKYGSVTIDNVHGYRISFAKTPILGFRGQFFVYLYERVDARVKRTPVNFGADTKGPLETLTITGQERNYEFKQLRLVTVHSGVTRRERYRILEFQYEGEYTDAKKVPCTIKNESKDVLEKSALEDDYKFGLGGNAEYLLGFDSRLSPTEGLALRFSSLRNKDNSWVEKIVELHDKQVADSKMTDFDLMFSGQSIKVSHDNLRHIYVDESFGEMLRFKILSITDALALPTEELVRVNPNFHTPGDLYDHEVNTRFDLRSDSATVETGTIVFKVQKSKLLTLPLK